MGNTVPGGKSLSQLATDDGFVHANPGVFGNSGDFAERSKLDIASECFVSVS